MKPTRFGRSVIFLGLCSLVLAACRIERPTEVRIKGDDKPIFDFKGSGKLSSFSVYLVPPSPEEMSKPFSEQTPVWRISAVPDYLHGLPIEEIGSLNYGTSPSGYKQDFPSNGDPVGSLKPNRDYFFDAHTTDAPPAAGFFRIENSKAISTNVKTPCWQTKDGQWVKSPCRL
jgi:hypothetical protein